MGFHCQVSQSSPSASILSTRCLCVELSSPARGPREWPSSPVIGFTMILEQAKHAAMALALDNIFLLWLVQRGLVLLLGLVK
jgi:hypothetical protein